MSDLITTAELSTTPRLRTLAASEVTRWVLLVLGAFVLAGVGLGVAWWQLATPLKVRFVDGAAVSWEGLDKTFDQVAIFALLSAGIGLVLGGVLAWFGRARALSTTIAVLVGSFLAGPIGYLVGHALGPSKIDSSAITGDALASAPLNLRGLSSDSPLVPFPDATLLVVALTAMVALAAVLMSTQSGVREPVSPSAEHR